MERKKIDLAASSGDPTVKRQATGGMSAKIAGTAKAHHDVDVANLSGAKEATVNCRGAQVGMIRINTEVVTDITQEV